LTWTRITDQDEAADLLPAWLGRRLIGLHGRFGLLLATVNLAHVVAAVEFIEMAPVEPAGESDTHTAAEVVAEMGRATVELSESKADSEGVL
jgi:hypothetical protein